MESEETEKFYDEYNKECEKTGKPKFYFGSLHASLCFICKNVDRHFGTWDPMTCNVLGKIPEEIYRCHKYECSAFDWNASVKDNVFFTADHKPKPLED